jgi:hypothetical protein
MKEKISTFYRISNGVLLRGDSLDAAERAILLV